jgi:magnesium transporter
MSQAKESLSQETVALELNQALDSGSLYQVRQLLKSLPSAGIAHLLESSPPKTRNVLWQLIDKAAEGEVLQDLNEDLQSEFLSELDAQQVVKLTAGLETDDLADILQQLPNQVTV